MSAKTKPQAKAPSLKPPAVLPPGAVALLSLRQIAGSLDVGRTKLRQMIASGEYPPPDTHLGAQAPRWHQDTHAEWCAARKGGKS